MPNRSCLAGCWDLLTSHSQSSHSPVGLIAAGILCLHGDLEAWNKTGNAAETLGRNQPEAFPVGSLSPEIALSQEQELGQCMPWDIQGIFPLRSANRCSGLTWFRE